MKTKIKQTASSGAQDADRVAMGVASEPRSLHGAEWPERKDRKGRRRQVWEKSALYEKGTQLKSTRERSSLTWIHLLASAAHQILV